jgi:flagellar protein FliL
MATTAAASTQPIVNAKTGKMKRIIIIAVAAAVLLGAGAGGAYFLLHKQGGAPEAAKPAPVLPPVFFPLESMTVNLQSDDGMHYLRVGLTLKIADEKAKAGIEERMPEVRSHILMLLSAKRPEDLAGIEGKRALAKELLTTVEMTGGTSEHPAHVQEVLFTEFVVQ